MLSEDIMVWDTGTKAVIIGYIKRIWRFCVTKERRRSDAGVKNKTKKMNTTDEKKTTDTTGR
jgi:hypothetical protein